MKIPTRQAAGVTVYTLFLREKRSLLSSEVSELTGVSVGLVREWLGKLHATGALDRRPSERPKEGYLYTLGKTAVEIIDDPGPQAKAAMRELQARKQGYEATQRVINRARQLRRRAGHSPFHCLTAQLLELRA